MELFSKGNFYLGVDNEKFCDLDIHLGRIVIQYTCPNGHNTNIPDYYFCPECRKLQTDGTNNQSSQESDN